MSRWDQLNWFVRFSQRPIDRLTASELQDLQNEITAIVWETRRFWMDTLLRSQQLKELQADIANHLLDFIVSGHTEYGPITAEHSVDVLAPRDKSHEKKATKRFFVHYRLTLQGREDKVAKDHLITYMFELLRDHGLLLEHCRHCSKVFLKLREHARYCSRQCQSVATMRIKRQQHRAAAKQTRRVTNGTSRR